MKLGRYREIFFSIHRSGTWGRILLHVTCWRTKYWETHCITPENNIYATADWNLPTMYFAANLTAVKKIMRLHDGLLHMWGHSYLILFQEGTQHLKPQRQKVKQKQLGTDYFAVNLTPPLYSVPGCTYGSAGRAPIIAATILEGNRDSLRTTSGAKNLAWSESFYIIIIFNIYLIFIILFFI